jgi:sulfur carrier protein ThiS
MKIRVKLYTILKKYGEGKIDQNDYMSLPEHKTLHGLAAYLGIPERQGKVFLVNGSPRSKEYKLSEGDEVKILGFIGGG